MMGDRGCRGVRGVLGAGGDSQYPGARRGIGASGALGPPRGCRRYWGLFGHQGVSGGVRGVLGASRDSRYSGARKCIGASRGIGGS